MDRLRSINIVWPTLRHALKTPHLVGYVRKICLEMFTAGSCTLKRLSDSPLLVTSAITG